MPKFACRCGYVMSLSNGYAEFELSLVPDYRLEDIAVRLDNLEKIDADRFFELIDEVGTTVYKCPACTRLYVDSGNGVFTSFVPEV